LKTIVEFQGLALRLVSRHRRGTWLFHRSSPANAAPRELCRGCEFRETGKSLPLNVRVSRRQTVGHARRTAGAESAGRDGQDSARRGGPGQRSCRGRALKSASSAVGRGDIAGQTDQRDTDFGKRHRQVNSLILQLSPVEFGHDSVEHHLLFAARIDSNRALVVAAVGIPDSERGKAGLMGDQIELERIDSPARRQSWSRRRKFL